MIKKGWDLADDEIAKQYAEVARTRRYDLQSAHRLIVIMIHRCLESKWLPKDALQVLDIGCGTGILLERLAEQFPAWNLVGIDPAIAPDSSARALTENSEMRHGSAYEVPTSSATQDLVILSEVLEHLNRPNRAFKEIQRLLKPTGIAIVTVPNASAFVGWRKFEKHLPPHRARRFLPAEHPLRSWQPIDTLYEYKEIIELVKSNGFEVLATDSAEFIPPFLHSAPLFGRYIYRTCNLDRVVKTVLPEWFGYRLALAIRSAE